MTRTEREDETVTTAAAAAMEGKCTDGTRSALLTCEV